MVMAQSTIVAVATLALFASSSALSVPSSSALLPSDGGGNSAAEGPAPRYWPQYSGARAVGTLDGTWSFGLLAAEGYPGPAPQGRKGGPWDWARIPAGPGGGFDSMDPGFGPGSALAATPNATAVPSCFDASDPGFLGSRGVGMYRTTFAHAGAARLQFQACSFYCRVWVDGVEIGEHTAGGYVAFSLDVPPQAPAAAAAGASRELFVLADNRFNMTTAPMHTGGDFWHYGGLMRSVELHSMPDAAAGAAPMPWRAYVLPSAAAPLSAVDVEVVLTDPGYSGLVDVTLAFDGGAAGAVQQAKAAAGVARIAGVAVPGAMPWSHASPHLHVLAVSTGGGTVSERFGLREFGVEAGSARLTINGAVTKLVGFGHHTQWPDTAVAATDAQMDADIALLRRAGANFVRGAHYPQDPRWLDRLDEAGMAMWSETIGPSVSSKDMQDPAWMRIQLRQLGEMLDNAMNHASIMTWGWFNEGPSNDAANCPAYKACADLARARDPTRFTTWATDKDLGDKCLEHASLISFNNYPSWYNSADPTEQWNKFANGVRAGATASGANATLGKPFMISETGAGGIFEWINATVPAADAVKWTLQFQSQIVAADTDVAIANDNISGVSLWHFFDFKVGEVKEENGTHCEYQVPATYPPNCSYIEINGRPGGYNHKGLIDFWRREKPIYDIVAAKFNATWKKS